MTTVISSLITADFPYPNTTSTAPPPQVTVVQPNIYCSGFTVNGKCIPWNVWLDVHNHSFPPSTTASGSPNPQPSAVFEAAPGINIEGPSTWCDGFTINHMCLSMAAVVSLMAVGTTSMSSTWMTATPNGTPTETSSTSETATPTETAPAPAAAKPNRKLGFIAIPLVVVTGAIITGIFFWLRRWKKNKVDEIPPRPAPETSTNAPSELMAQTVTQLYKELGFDVSHLESRGQASGEAVGGKEQRRSRYNDKGVKIFDTVHEKRSREMGEARDGAGECSRSWSPPRHEWTGDRMLF